MRIFIPEVEAVYMKDYQCDYYRGIVIDNEDNIVERCSKKHSSRNRALQDAELKILDSPVYSKNTTSKLAAKLEEYKEQKKEKEKKNAFVVYNPHEWNEWQYIFDKELYRVRYMNQNKHTSLWLAGKSGLVGDVITEQLCRCGEDDKNFYLNRVNSISDFENLPGHKDIWKITRVIDIKQHTNKDCLITVEYRKYSNIRKDYNKGLRKKKIKVKSQWSFFNELMNYFTKLK